MRFRNREQAGRMLVDKLRAYARRPDVIVLALPRGGVPVAAALAAGLEVALDVFPVRKLGVPGHEEYAMGALASGGWRVLNEEAVRALNINPDVIAAVTDREELELQRRESLYRGSVAPPDLANRVTILVDDGLATGMTMRAAALAVRHQHPQRLIIAVPVAARESCEALQHEADELHCLDMPTPFYSVGQCYENFPQTSDEEVIALLQREAERQRLQRTKIEGST